MSWVTPEKFAAQVVLNVCELSDYTSPDDQPDLLQCTVKELECCVIRAFEHFDPHGAASGETMTGEEVCTNCGAYKRGEVHICNHPANRYPHEHEWQDGQCLRCGCLIHHVAAICLCNGAKSQ